MTLSRLYKHWISVQHRERHQKRQQTLLHIAKEPKLTATNPSDREAELFTKLFIVTVALCFAPFFCKDKQSAHVKR